jgi:hypothetical protein
MLRWVGSWRTLRAAAVLVGAALAGLIGTVVIRHDPGFLIGFFIIVGSVVAAIGARRAVHRLIPLPALSYFVATFGAGYVHDKANLVTSKELYTSFLSWIGSAFFAVVWATVIIVVIAFTRWLMSKRLVSGTLTATPSAPARTVAASASADPRDRDFHDPRGQRDPRADRAPRDGSRGAFNDPSPGGNAFGNARDERGRRGDSGAWDGPSRQGDRDQRPARDSRDRPARRDDRGTRDGRDSRDEQPPRRDGDSRYGDRTRDNRRPRTADGPRDLW